MARQRKIRTDCSEGEKQAGTAKLNRRLNLNLRERVIRKEPLRMDGSEYSRDTVTGRSLRTEARRAKVARFAVAGSLLVGLLGVVGCAGPTLSAEPTETPGVGESGPDESIEEDEVATGFVGIPTVESLEMRADMSPEQVALQFTEIISDWFSAGANQANYDLRYEGDNGLIPQSEFVQKIADEAKPIFAEALYGSRWNTPEFSDSVERLSANHFSSLAAYFTTNNSNYPEPRVRDEKLVEFDSVVFSGDGQLESMRIVIEYIDNGSDIGVDYTIDGLRESGTVTFLSEGARLVLASPLNIRVE